MSWMSLRSHIAPHIAGCLVVGMGSVLLGVPQHSRAQEALPSAKIHSATRIKGSVRIEIAIPMGFDGVEVYRRRDSYELLNGKKIPDSERLQSVLIATITREAGSMLAWCQDQNVVDSVPYTYKVRPFLTEKVNRQVKYRRRLIEVEIEEKRFAADSPEKSVPALGAPPTNLRETPSAPQDSMEALLKVSQLHNDLKTAVTLGHLDKARVLRDEWHRYQKSESWRQVEPRFSPVVKVLENALTGLEQAVQPPRNVGESPPLGSLLREPPALNGAQKGGLIPVSPEYDFTPQVPIREGANTWSKRGAICFTNQGPKRVTGRLVYIDGPFFAAGHSQNNKDAWTGFSLRSGEAIEFRVQFTPRAAGSFDGKLTVETDGSSRPVSITLRGRGEKKEALSKPDEGLSPWRIKR